MLTWRGVSVRDQELWAVRGALRGFYRMGGFLIGSVFGHAFCGGHRFVAEWWTSALIGFRNVDANRFRNGGGFCNGVDRGFS